MWCRPWDTTAKSVGGPWRGRQLGVQLGLLLGCSNTTKTSAKSTQQHKPETKHILITMYASTVCRLLLVLVMMHDVELGVSNYMYLEEHECGELVPRLGTTEQDGWLCSSPFPTQSLAGCIGKVISFPGSLGVSGRRWTNMENGRRGCEPFVLGRNRGIFHPCFAVHCGGPSKPTVSLLVIRGKASEPIGNIRWWPIGGSQGAARFGNSMMTLVKSACGDRLFGCSNLTRRLRFSGVKIPSDLNS